MVDSVKTKTLAVVLAEDFDEEIANGLPRLATDLKWFIKTFPGMNYDMVLDFAGNYPFNKETAYAGSPSEYFNKKYGKDFVEAVRVGIKDKELAKTWKIEDTLTGGLEGKKAAFFINKKDTANTRTMLGNTAETNDIKDPKTFKVVFAPKKGSKAKPIELKELLGIIKSSKQEIGEKKREVYKKDVIYAGFSPALQSYKEQKKAQAEANKKAREERKAQKKEETSRSSAPTKPVEDKPVFTQGTGGSRRPKK